MASPSPGRTTTRSGSRCAGSPPTKETHERSERPRGPRRRTARRGDRDGPADPLPPRRHRAYPGPDRGPGARVPRERWRPGYPHRSHYRTGIPVNSDIVNPSVEDIVAGYNARIASLTQQLVLAEARGAALERALNEATAEKSEED